MSERPEAEPWLVDNLRVSTFHDGKLDDNDVRKWLSIVVGSEPDNFNINPREQSIVAVLTRKDAPVPFQLQLAVQNKQLRADWTVRPLPKADQLEVGILSLGSMDAAISNIGTTAERWLDTAPKIKRIAFGVTVARSIESAREAFRFIDESVSAFDIGNAASTDFILQYNNPRPSRELTERYKRKVIINCLVKWLIAQQHAIDVKIAQGVQQVISPERISLLCLRELDINTQPAINLAHEFTKDILPDILHEMFDIARQE